MWTRSSLKDKAKKILKGNYWQAFLVSLVILITGGSHNRGEVGSSAGSSGGAEVGGGSFFDFEIALIVGTVILLIIILRIFIGYVLEVGGRKYFIKLSEGESKVSYLGYGFKNNNYFNIFWTMLLRSIYVILWSLLLIIPGIIKFYAYRMVPYILADNPEMGHRKAIKLSNKMTQGEKWDIFILDLSFLGWFILGSLFFGIGILFVQPYYDATNAELYLNLRKKAITNNLITENELNINNDKL
uniref:Integral membrane protein n=1 Tax=uncultured organism TaxID=155900 RepID=M1P223_9ZZZZ|nr:integral membrane protein [uncultured organism]